MSIDAKFVELTADIVRAHINELATSEFDYFFIIQFKLHLIGQKMNHRAGISELLQN